MDCLNQTISVVTFRCLEEICFSKSRQLCSSSGAEIAASIVTTAVAVGILCFLVIVVLHVWFYKPRMTGRHGSCDRRMDHDHPYEVVDEEPRAASVSQPPIKIDLKKNKVRLSKLEK